MVDPESLATAKELLSNAADRSKRHNVAYERSFVRVTNAVPDVVPPAPALARLIQGGRGGEVRLKLYLLLTMMATQRPFDIRNPPTPLTLSRTLALPPTTGPRRINDNLRWLEDNHFIERAKRPGQTPSIQLMDLHLPDRPLPDPRRSGPYLTVPIGFWSCGWLLELSPTGIAVLFALIERLGGAKVPMYLTRSRHDSYELSHDTWTRGRNELEGHHLLRVTRVPQGNDFDYRRLRNCYWLEKERLSMSPELAAARFAVA